MFQLLRQYSSRWEELSVGVTSEIVPLLAALRGQVPSLKRSWIYWSCPESRTSSIDCFETASSLVDIGIFHQHRFIPIVLPPHQLTRYELNRPWEQHSVILNLAPNLVEARIAIAFDVEPWPDTDETIDLMHLQRLYVSDVDVLDYLKLLFWRNSHSWFSKLRIPVFRYFSTLFLFARLLLCEDFASKTGPMLRQLPKCYNGQPPLLNS
ncbi:hypothetical protein B0H19DRAFT_1112473 [Mycena capillaripes]|nr:hypothetical protein B0H19DRAFT_1112473 [Mycena capillaripes]